MTQRNWGDHTGPRRSTMRIGWVRGPKSWRRIFLLEMARSNNLIRAISKAKIRYTTYVEWVASGFLSQSMLDAALVTFRSKHPSLDMLAATQSDVELEEQGYGVAATEAIVAVDISPQMDVEGLHGYSPGEVLDPTGWIGDYDDDM